jgi:hypothetical protein
MRNWALLLGFLTMLTAASGSQPRRGLDDLKVLFIGDRDSSRAIQFQGFLQQNVGKVEFALRKGFKPSQADAFDVVLLDWPQSDSTREDWKSGRSPLGERDAWTKPTVLLGSAGLNIAVVWKVRGGSG